MKNVLARQNAPAYRNCRINILPDLVLSHLSSVTCSASALRIFSQLRIPQLDEPAWICPSLKNLMDRKWVGLEIVGIAATEIRGKDRPDQTRPVLVVKFQSSPSTGVLLKGFSGVSE